VTGPGDETSVPAAGHGRLRASHADREQVIDALKAAFVQGRLTKEGLDARAGRALAARTYAELAAVTADIPAGPDPVHPPKRARAQPRRPRNQGASRAVKSGAAAIAAMVLAATAAAAVTGDSRPLILAFFIVIAATICTAFVASVIAVALGFESLHRRYSRRRLPPGSASGTDGHRVDGPSTASANMWRQLGPHCSQIPAG
jgi:Domain of unknown function (DUF1707)